MTTRPPRHAPCAIESPANPKETGGPRLLMALVMAQPTEQVGGRTARRVYCWDGATPEVDRIPPPLAGPSWGYFEPAQGNSPDSQHTLFY